MNEVCYGREGVYPKRNKSVHINKTTQIGERGMLWSGGGYPKRNKSIHINKTTQIGERGMLWSGGG